MSPARESHHDVVVVGARCAGAATALLLARAGHDVLLVDRARLPGDTNSTHSLVRGGVVQLSRWGLLDEVLATGAPAIRSVTFHQYGPAAPAPCGCRSRTRPASTTCSPPGGTSSTGSSRTPPSGWGHPHGPDDRRRRRA